jgi:SPP1 gp7 family putative phage head morphogenesis protein
VEAFRDNVTRIVTDGIGQGVGPRKLEQQIRTALLGAKDPQGLNNIMGLRQRAELIARSEIANAYVDAQKAAAARNGFAYGRWIATKDERTCPVCASRHGRIYRLDQMVGILHPRCRCSISPVSSDAVEESDPRLRAILLRDDYWERARKDLTDQFAESKKWPFERASKVLEDAVLKPSASEKRRYPDIKEAPQPVG